MIQLMNSLLTLSFFVIHPHLLPHLWIMVSSMLQVERGESSPTRGQISHDFPIVLSATGRARWFLDSWDLLMESDCCPP